MPVLRRGKKRDAGGEAMKAPKFWIRWKLSRLEKERSRMQSMQMRNGAYAFPFMLACLDQEIAALKEMLEVGK